MFESKQKILVEIYDSTGLKSRKKYPIEADQVVIRKGRPVPGGAAYKAKFDEDCVVYFWSGYWPFKSLKRKLMLQDGATECINIRAPPMIFKIPMWDRATEEELFKASVIKASGASMLKLQIPTLLYIMSFAGIAISVIILMVLTGRVRI
jgi:hypothetical protein